MNNMCRHITHTIQQGTLNYHFFCFNNECKQLEIILKKMTRDAETTKVNIQSDHLKFLAER